MVAVSLVSYYSNRRAGGVFFGLRSEGRPFSYAPFPSSLSSLPLSEVSGPVRLRGLAHFARAKSDVPFFPQ